MTDIDPIQTSLTPVTGPAGATSTKPTPTLVMDDVADLQNQSVPVSINPVHKRKCAIALGSDGQPGTSRYEVAEETPRSLQLSEL